MFEYKVSKKTENGILEDRIRAIAEFTADHRQN